MVSELPSPFSGMSLLVDAPERYRTSGGSRWLGLVGTAGLYGLVLVCLFATFRTMVEPPRASAALMVEQVPLASPEETPPKDKEAPRPVEKQEPAPPPPKVEPREPVAIALSPLQTPATVTPPKLPDPAPPRPETAAPETVPARPLPRSQAMPQIAGRDGSLPGSTSIGAIPLEPMPAVSKAFPISVSRWTGTGVCCRPASNAPAVSLNSIAKRRHWRNVPSHCPGRRKTGPVIRWNWSFRSNFSFAEGETAIP